MEKNHFYKNMKFLRGKKSITKFAEQLGYSTSTLSRWESNNNGATLDSVIDISHKLDIPISELICEDLELRKNVVLDEKHKLENMIVDKTYQMSDQDKKMLIGIIDSINNNVDKK